MNKITALLFTLFVFFAPLALQAETNGASFRITSVATNGTAQGEGSAISVQALLSYADAGYGRALTQTTSIASIPWPQRVFVRLVDGSSNDTLTCTAFVLKGTDQFGASVTERIATIDETGEFSNTVFEKITRASGIGCGAADGAPTGSDYVAVSAPFTHVGLRSKISGSTDVVALCLVDESDTPDAVACATATGIASAVSIARSCGPSASERCYTVDLTTSSLFPNASPPAANDVLQMQWRMR